MCRSTEKVSIFVYHLAFWTVLIYLCSFYLSSSYATFSRNSFSRSVNEAIFPSELWKQSENTWEAKQHFITLRSLKAAKALKF